MTSPWEEFKSGIRKLNDRDKVVRPIASTKKNSKNHSSARYPFAFIWRKKKDELFIEGRLDLHGLTVDNAWRTLHHFFDKMQRQRKRHLLIITGKGKGVMQKTLHDFLERHESIISEVKTPPIRYGGDGACYIILKKQTVEND